jgi:hypothetical protein
MRQSSTLPRMCAALAALREVARAFELGTSGAGGVAGGARPATEAQGRFLAAAARPALAVGRAALAAAADSLPAAEALRCDTARGWKGLWWNGLGCRVGNGRVGGNQRDGLKEGGQLY